jgi:hypothetical protein
VKVVLEVQVLDMEVRVVELDGYLMEIMGKDHLLILLVVLDGLVEVLMDLEQAV